MDEKEKDKIHKLQKMIHEKGPDESVEKVLFIVPVMVYRWILVGCIINFLVDSG